MERPNAWKAYDENALKDLEAVSTRYRAFLDNGKTERECVQQAVEMAKAHGYTDLADAVKAGRRLNPGDKLYSVCMDKSIMLFHLGQAPLEDGINVVGAHIDSPRIDVKQNPFYEDTNLAYADTHYYGGIKKYQWTAIPLSLHGAVYLKDGTCVRLRQGRADDVTVYGDDPAQQARDWREQGGRELHVVDLDGAFAGTPRHAETIRRIIEAFGGPVEVGGGLRTPDALRAVIEAGAARAIIGSAALEDPEFLTRALELYGDRIAVGIDARDGFVQTKGWVTTTDVMPRRLFRRTISESMDCAVTGSRPLVGSS